MSVTSSSGRTRVHLPAIALALSSVATVLVASPASATGPFDVVFTYTGTQQTFTVPDGVQRIRVEAVGAPGASLPCNDGDGGLGHRVTGELSVTPGTVLFVLVGGRGEDGGFNGGGQGWAASGGGASDVRSINSMLGSGSLESRLIIAAGGGGAGAGGPFCQLGGFAGFAAGGIAGGFAGTASSGGAGGGTAPCVGCLGAAGVLGYGGAGAGIEAAGGGGGGGLYGGGGGGFSCETFSCYGGGGGGGSSFTGDAADASVEQAAFGEDPSVTITYELPPSADVGVAITAPATASRSLSYAIAVTNLGPDAATDVVLTDVLPAGTTFQSATVPSGWSCAFPPKGRGGTVTCTVASLAAGATQPASLVVKVGAATRKAGSITNTVMVTSGTPDPVLSNNSATATTATGT